MVVEHQEGLGFAVEQGSEVPLRDIVSVCVRDLYRYVHTTPLLFNLNAQTHVSSHVKKQWLLAVRARLYVINLSSKYFLAERQTLSTKPSVALSSD
jgi:hypothetical protein